MKWDRCRTGPAIAVAIKISIALDLLWNPYCVRYSLT